MEHVSDERKAFELSSMSMNDFSIKESNAAYNAALAMAQWKDEQSAKEKQQLIDNAVDFISKRFYIGINNHVISKEDYYTLTELIRDFEQAMKGE